MRTLKTSEIPVLALYVAAGFVAGAIACFVVGTAMFKLAEMLGVL